MANEQEQTTTEALIATAREYGNQWATCSTVALLAESLLARVKALEEEVRRLESRSFGANKRLDALEKPQAEPPARDETLLPTVDQWMEREGKEPRKYREAFYWDRWYADIQNAPNASQLPESILRIILPEGVGIAYPSREAAVDALEVALHSLGLVRLREKPQAEQPQAVSPLLELAAKWERKAEASLRPYNVMWRECAAELREALAAQQ